MSLVSQRFWLKSGNTLEELDMMNRMDRFHLEHPEYGSRRLGKQFGISRDKSHRLMQVMHLAATYPKRRTTVPHLEHAKFPYLLGNVKIERINQVWSTDITYIGLPLDLVSNSGGKHFLPPILYHMVLYCLHKTRLCKGSGILFHEDFLKVETYVPMGAGYCGSIMFIFLLIFLATVTVGTAVAESTDSAMLTRFEFRDIKMAVPVRIVLYSSDEDTANKAAAAAFARFDDINVAMSDYDDTSEIRRITRCVDDFFDTGNTTNTENVVISPDGYVTVGDDLYHVLVAARKYTELTDGAFDVTISPVVRLWRRARRLHRLPTESQIQEALHYVGNDKWELHPTEQKIRMLRRGVRFDFGGIAKGYALDVAMMAIRQHGITSALIDAGGDIIVSGPPPVSDQSNPALTLGAPTQKPALTLGAMYKNGTGWRISIATESHSAIDVAVHPEKEKLLPIIFLADAAIANSGDTFQFVEIDGKRYSHLVDPRTGQAVTDRKPVTVVSSTAIEADVLASALCILGTSRNNESSVALCFDKIFFGSDTPIFQFFWESTDTNDIR